LELIFKKPLSQALAVISEKCVACGLCAKSCQFLRKYGTPKQIAENFDLFDKTQRNMVYGCNLCRLCTAVCPKGLDPATMFLEMRREAVQNGVGDYRAHRRVFNYEHLGISKRYSWYGLPENCDTIFFPGCTLSGTRPGKVFAFYEYLKAHIPNAGIVLDCCTKPSHDLGRQDFFQNMFNEMKHFLLDNGVRKILVACPNCYRVFKEYAQEMIITTAYEFMANDGIPTRRPTGEIVTVHDPCALRFDEAIQLAVRQLLEKQGLTVEEMRHTGKKTLCCGEGGSACCIAPELSEQWGILRKKEVNGHRAFTYCAGCVNRLKSVMPVTHVMDLMFEPEKALKGKSRSSKPPMTYVNRLLLKRRMKKKVDASVSREREFTASD
jgi:Fe-S oxidoreductase